MKHKIIILNNLRTMSKKLASIFLFIAAILTAISFTSCDREEEYQSGNKPTNNNISLTGQWIQINIDESERFPMKTYYTFFTDGTCAEDLYIKTGNNYSKNSRTEYTYIYNKDNSLLTLINLERLDAQGNLIYKYATLSMSGNILNFYWTDGRKEQYTKQ